MKLITLDSITQKEIEYLRNNNNVGIELEIRQKLGKGNYLENITLYGNAMIQTSKVRDDRTGNSQRNIQGQSPYLINAGILMIEPKTNFSFDIFD
jgi:hypothetical protein